jgi:hypothetical protein
MVSWFKDKARTASVSGESFSNELARRAGLMDKESLVLMVEFEFKHIFG